MSDSTERLNELADGIEDEAIGYVGEDEDTEGATMVSKQEMLSWRDEIREVVADIGQGGGESA